MVHSTSCSQKNKNKPQVSMKAFNKTSPMSPRRLVGNPLTQRRTLIAAVAGLAVTACLTATAITVIDVTTAGSSGTANGAIFSFADPQPTGTGYIDPFLREQNTGGELGVNTSIKAQTVNNTVAYDNKDPVNYTHDLAISTLLPVNGYYKFALDANQVANAAISLIRFQIFVSATAFTDATALGTFISGTPAFDMNGGGTGLHRVDITSNSGSGSGDMTVLVPTAGIIGNNYLYLVAGFGLDANNAGYDSNDGFEEWSAATGTPPPPGVPDGGSTLLLLGSAFASLGLFARGRKTASIA
jgi:hypothetical protein